MLVNKSEELRLSCMVAIFENLSKAIDNVGDFDKKMELESFKGYFYNNISLHADSMSELISVCDKLNCILVDCNYSEDNLCKIVKDVKTLANLKQVGAISDITYTESIASLTNAMRHGESIETDKCVMTTIDDIYCRVHQHTKNSGKMRSYYSSLLNMSDTSFANRLTRKSFSLKDVLLILNN